MAKFEDLAEKTELQGNDVTILNDEATIQGSTAYQAPRTQIYNFLNLVEDLPERTQALENNMLVRKFSDALALYNEVQGAGINKFKQYFTINVPESSLYYRVGINLLLEVGQFASSQFEFFPSGDFFYCTWGNSGGQDGVVKATFYKGEFNYEDAINGTGENPFERPAYTSKNGLYIASKIVVPPTQFDDITGERPDNDTAVISRCFIGEEGNAWMLWNQYTGVAWAYGKNL